MRKGVLTLLNLWGNTEPLVPIGGENFRTGQDPLSRGILSLSTVVGGRTLRADYSGIPATPFSGLLMRRRRGTFQAR